MRIRFVRTRMFSGSLFLTPIVVIWLILARPITSGAGPATPRRADPGEPLGANDDHLLEDH
jgi:hypothetical protein